MEYTVNGILQASILEWVTFSFSRGSSQPRDWTQVSPLWAESLPVQPPGKTKNTAVGSPSPLHRIFLTRELNLDFLHCRWILYQLTYQGSLIDIISKELTEENLMKMSVFWTTTRWEEEVEEAVPENKLTSDNLTRRVPIIQEFFELFYKMDTSVIQVLRLRQIVEKGFVPGSR